MKGFLAFVIALLLAAGAVAVALAHRPVEVRKVRTTETELRPGQTEVTGVVTFVRADPADAPPMPLPVTIAVPQRGAGGGTISHAAGGIAIEWDGGTPLTLQGGPGAALDAAPAPVEVSAAGVRWMLDGHANAFAPGRYTVVAPVAVGTGGLATPRDRADFTADAATVLVTRGGAFIDRPLAALTLTGPGEVRLEGRLRLRTRDGSTTADHAAFSAGAYQLTLTPGPDGLRVSALLQGARRA